MQRITRQKCKGFTLVELLVVIGIIAILMSLLLPMLATVKEVSKRSVCMSNQSKLAIAYIAYITDNAGLLVSATTGTLSWADGGNLDDNIRQGLLYPYTPDVTIYKCPSDFNLINVRSYSLNDLLNSGENWTGTNPYVRLSQEKRPGTTFLFIEEFDPRGYNLGGFAVNASGDSWVDYPAHFHGDGINISFLDGSVQYWKFVDPRTIQINDFFAYTPGDPDLYQLEKWIGLP